MTQPARYQFATLRLSSHLPQTSRITLCKTSRDPIEFWLILSGLGQLDPVRKQANVQESFWPVLPSRSGPNRIRHVYWGVSKNISMFILPNLCLIISVIILVIVRWLCGRCNDYLYCPCILDAKDIIPPPPPPAFLLHPRPLFFFLLYEVCKYKECSLSLSPRPSVGPSVCLSVSPPLSLSLCECMCMV